MQQIYFSFFQISCIDLLLKINNIQPSIILRYDASNYVTIKYGYNSISSYYYLNFSRDGLGHKTVLSGIDTPKSSDHAATKGYVDGLIPTAYTSNPSMDGTASAGSSTSWAKGDHVHPTDTSRMAANLKGAVNGVAELDANGKVPITQIPDASKLPTVSSSDNGKVLMVVNGAWAVASLPIYNGGIS